jgi:hypothetical protein
MQYSFHLRGVAIARLHALCRIEQDDDPVDASKCDSSPHFASVDVSEELKMLAGLAASR